MKTETAQSIVAELIDVYGMTVEQIADELKTNVKAIEKYRAGTKAIYYYLKALKIVVRRKRNAGKTQIEALATLEVGNERYCHLWIVEDCPICGDKHRHGGGAYNEDPRQLLGGRAAHCHPVTDPMGRRGDIQTPEGDYTLVEKVASNGK